MKSIILLIGLASNAWAQQGITNTHEVATSTQTLIQSIALSGDLTNMGTAISSGNVAGYFAIEVYNVATSSSVIVCGFDVSLSSTIGGVWYGREISAGEGVPSYRPLYCRNVTLATPNTSPVTVTLFK